MSGERASKAYQEQHFPQPVFPVRAVFPALLPFWRQSCRITCAG